MRTRESLNGGWRFRKGPAGRGGRLPAPDASWDAVSIPHTWNARDVHDDEHPYYRGEAWYARTFRLARADRGRRLHLLFEGANQLATVYVNGREAGRHNGGYTAFALDVTALVRPGADNALAVRLSNALDPDTPPLAGDMMNFGGLYRSVWLVRTGPVHFDLADATSGVYIDTPEAGPRRAAVRVRGRLRNTLARARTVWVRHELRDPDGRALPPLEGEVRVPAGGTAGFEFCSAPIERPRRWSPDDPALHEARSTLSAGRRGRALDDVSNAFGIRRVEVRPGGFYLNGRRLFIRGVGKHQDHPGLGYAVPEEILRRDMRLIRDMGANFTKTHYPLAAAAYDEGDRVGVMSWARVPIMDKVHTTPVFLDATRAMAREMILQHYNHPSVVMWGSACEPLGDIDWFWPRPIPEAKRRRHLAATRDFFERIEAFMRELDPSRPTANEFHTDPHPEWYDEAGLTRIQSINGWNVYQGWYHASLADLPRMLRRIEGWERGRPWLLAEHGAGSDTRIHTHEPTIFDFSTEYQELFHRHYLKVLPRFPRIAGMLIWTFFDFEAWHQRNTMPHVNNKGMVTGDRRPKDVYYLFQAHWGDRPMAHIAAAHWTRRVAFARPGAAVRQPIRVYSNLARVELFHNGRSLGARPAAGREAAWTVPFVEGANLLRAVARTGRTAVEDAAEIRFEFLPPDLRRAFPRRLCINLGQSRTVFTDPLTGDTWVPDRPYRRGSFGFVDGEYYRRWPAMPAWEGIREGVDATILGTDIDPVFQTFRVGLTDYRVDAPDGRYRAHLYFAEPFAEAQRRDAAAGAGADREGRRAFDVALNGDVRREALDLAAQYGARRAVVERFDVRCAGGRGLRVELRPVRGRPVLNGLVVEPLP